MKRSLVSLLERRLKGGIGGEEKSAWSIGDDQHRASRGATGSSSDSALQAADGSSAARSGSNMAPPRSNGGDRPAGHFGNPPAPSRTYSPVAASPDGGSSELANLTLSELQARKRELKQQLKQYDWNFARRHGRKPVKAEQEPIRNLYASYHAAN
jgi:hypothetical protein